MLVDLFDAGLTVENEISAVGGGSIGDLFALLVHGVQVADHHVVCKGHFGGDFDYFGRELVVLVRA